MGIPSFISGKQTRFVYLQIKWETYFIVLNGSFEAGWDYIKNILK